MRRKNFTLAGCWKKYSVTRMITAALKAPGKVTGKLATITSRTLTGDVDKIWTDAEIAGYLDEVAGKLTEISGQVNPNPVFREVQ